jgi:hypothetical protein
VDEADMAQAREEAREKTKKKVKSTSIEIPGEVTVDMEDDKKKEEQPAPAAAKAEVGGDKKPVEKPGEVAGSGTGDGVKPKTVKTTKCAVCGQVVKAQGIGAHMRRVHPELMNTTPKQGKSPANTGEEEETSEAGEKPLVPLNFEELKKNPVVVAVLVGVAALVGLVLLMLFMKPKDQEAGAEGAVAESAQSEASPVAPAPLKFEEQEGREFEESMPDGTTRRFKIVRDTSTGIYNHVPI